MFTLTRTTFVLLALGVAAGVSAAIALYPRICEAFGPMSLHESQCLVCGRERTEKWVCGTKVLDEVSTTVQSNWVDTIVSAMHPHVWLSYSSRYRQHWFGNCPIACGGSAVLSRIYEQREKLGEEVAADLLSVWHQRLTAPGFVPLDLSVLDAFEAQVVNDPLALLPDRKPVAEDAPNR